MSEFGTPEQNGSGEIRRKNYYRAKHRKTTDDYYQSLFTAQRELQTVMSLVVDDIKDKGMYEKRMFFSRDIDEGKLTLASLGFLYVQKQKSEDHFAVVINRSAENSYDSIQPSVFASQYVLNVNRETPGITVDFDVVQLEDGGFVADEDNTGVLGCVWQDTDDQYVIFRDNTRKISLPDNVMLDSAEELEAWSQVHLARSLHGLLASFTQATLDESYPYER